MRVDSRIARHAAVSLLLCPKVCLVPISEGEKAQRSQAFNSKPEERRVRTRRDVAGSKQGVPSEVVARTGTCRAGIGTEEASENLPYLVSLDTCTQFRVFRKVQLDGQHQIQETPQKMSF